MEKERAVTHEQMMKAIMSKKIVIQQSKPLRKHQESDLERIERQIRWILSGW